MHNMSNIKLTVSAADVA